MASKNILVIGSLSLDEIHLTNTAPGGGGTTVSQQRHKEHGGRGGNTAISAYRATRVKPADGSGIGATANGDEQDRIDVHLIAGVADKHNEESFKTRLDNNGVITDGVEILPHLGGEDGGIVEQDYLVSIMVSDTGKTNQLVNFSTTDQWPVDRFDDVTKICGSMVPDLVIVTMELKNRVVEQIIETFHAASIDVLLFAAPGEPILFDTYQKIAHLVCNESDAARMLGYKLEEIGKDNWSTICDTFIQRGVKNVVLKLGNLGAYFKNDQGEGFVSGYTRISDLIDQTGATNAFVGPYATQFVKDKQRWDLKDATERGNKAASLFATDIGYESAIPWSDEVDDANLEPLYASIEQLREGPLKKKLIPRKYRDQRAPIRPRGPTI